MADLFKDPDKQLESAIVGPPAPKPGNATVAAKPAATPGPTLPSGAGAGQIAKLSGSPAPNGKPRKDNLVPGSPEAIKADREAARLAKQKQRARNRAQVVPPPLPARTHTPSPALVDQTHAQIPDGASPVRVEDAEMVPWLSEDLSGPLLDTLELVEEADKFSIETKLQQAHLSPENVREVMRDAVWPERAKRGLSKYGAGALAKGLNALGLSAKHRDVALIVPSLAFLITDRIKLHKRLDALIAAANPPAAPSPGQTPKP